MKNSIFKFKQFDLLQSDVQLKVTTEATLFGAWVFVSDGKSVLDIGSGTGVLSLMLGQKAKIQVDAVELQKEAAEICRENFENSPWPEQLNVFHTSIQDFQPNKKYDVIVSNPPFFFQQTNRKTAGKNTAMHNSTLSLQDLLNAVTRLLDREGRFYLLLPPGEMKSFVDAAAGKNLYLHEKLELIHKAGKPVLREAACFSFDKPEHIQIRQFIMRNEDESYSNAYREMLKEYLIIF